MYRPRAWRSVMPLLTAALLLAGAASQAQVPFTVHLDTSVLMGSADGPFWLDFQLTDGSGTDDGNNTATLSNFDFGTGGPIGAATTSGGASGDLAAGIALTDSSFLNELYQSFTPGSTLTFDVALTANADAGATPDEFSFTILDGTLSGIPTTGATGALLTADITPRGIVIQTFGGADAYAAMGAPRVTYAVPEPGALPALGAGLAVSLLALRRRRR